MSENAALSRQEKDRILRERAKILAQEPMSSGAAEEAIPIVAFLLAREIYAIEMAFLREIYPLRDLTPLPCTPRFIRGIANIRGEILTVIDLREFFGLPTKGITDLNKILIVHTEEMTLGILADEILGVRLLPLSHIQPPLPTLSGIRAEYLRGVTTERLILLDMARIVADEQLLVDEATGP